MMNTLQQNADLLKSPYPCQRAVPVPRSRREMLRQCGGGLGGIALAALLRERAYGIEPESVFAGQVNVAGDRAEYGLHHRPTAKRIIFLYMDGGPSQVDTAALQQ